MIFSASPHPVVYFAVLAAIFTYLYKSFRQDHFLLWSVGWMTLLARQIALTASSTDGTVWAWLDVVLVLSAAALIVAGGVVYAGRVRLGPIGGMVFGLALGGVTALAFLAVGALHPAPSRPWSAAISFLAAGWIGTGWLIDRFGRATAPTGSRLAGVALAVWGITQPAGWILAARDLGTSWLPQADAALGALLAVGMLILGFEEARAQIAAELEKSNQLKSEFLSNTSHELKTPLTSIIANTEILEYEMCGPITEEQRQVLAHIDRNSQHLLEMISRLLDFARYEEGHDLLRYERVDPRALLDGVVRTVTPLIEEKPLRIELDVEEGLDACWIDAEKIYRVYLNLVENAIKFSAGGVVTVVARRVDGELEGAVTDEGIGIPPERLQDIFDAFRQVDASSTRPYQGVGLGLAICRQLVELHHGRIWAESKPGKGSRFAFRIPCRPEEPER